MDTVITRHWWALVLRGMVAVLFGLAALVWPDLTLVALVALFGAFALVDGIFAAVAGVGAIGHGRHWVALLVGAALGILIGVAAFLLPGLTALSLVYLIAAWSVIGGVTGVSAALQSPGRRVSALLIGISGLLSVVFGLVLFAFPGAGALSLVWLIGIYALGFGITLMGAGVRLRVRRDVRRGLLPMPTHA